MQPLDWSLVYRREYTNINLYLNSQLEVPFYRPRVKWFSSLIANDMRLFKAYVNIIVHLRTII